MDEIKKLTEQLIVEFEKLGWRTKPDKEQGALEDISLKLWEGGKIEWEQLIGKNQGFRMIEMNDKARLIWEGENGSL